MLNIRRTRALVGSFAVAAAAVACALPASAATSPAPTATPTATATGTPPAAASPVPTGSPTAVTASPAASPTVTPTTSPTVTKPSTTAKPAAKAAAKSAPKIIWVSKHTISVGGRYIINPDGFRETMTLENANYRNGFTVATKTPYKGKVQAFPDFLYGCSWGVCSPHRTLPVQVKHDGDPGASVNTAGHPKGIYNAAYDIWLELKPYLGGQPHGAEIMIWNRETPGIGSTRGAPKVRVDGALYWLIHWRAHNSNGYWNYIQFRKVSQTNDLRGIHINDFIRVTDAHHLTTPNWYLQNITAGFEIWSGGQGLQMSNFWAQG